MILVTGGLGFIGSNLVRALDADGIETLVVDNVHKHWQGWHYLAGCKRVDIIGAERFYPALRNDVATHGALGDATIRLREVEAFVHLGGLSATSEENLDALIERNLFGSQLLFDRAVHAQIPIIWASSAATYGDGSAGFQEDPIERLPTPANAYVWSKHVFDLWAQRQKNKPPHWYGLKPFNVYGPSEDHKGGMASPAHRYAEDARNNRPLIAWRRIAPGAFPTDYAMRDFVHVDDVVAMIQFFLFERAGPLPLNGFYNVGIGEAHPFRSVAEAVRAKYVDATVIEKADDSRDAPPSLRAPGYQWYTRADLTKLRAAGYDRPFLTLEQGVERMLGGYRRDRPIVVSSNRSRQEFCF